MTTRQISCVPGHPPRTMGGICVRFLHPFSPLLFGLHKRLLTSSVAKDSLSSRGAEGVSKHVHFFFKREPDFSPIHSGSCLPFLSNRIGGVARRLAIGNDTTAPMGLGHHLISCYDSAMTADRPIHGSLSIYVVIALVVKCLLHASMFVQCSTIDKQLPLSTVATAASQTLDLAGYYLVIFSNFHCCAVES